LLPFYGKVLKAYLQKITRRQPGFQMEEALKKLFRILLEQTRSCKNLVVLAIPIKRLWRHSKRGVIIASVFSVLEALLWSVGPVVSRYLADTIVRGLSMGWEKPMPHSIYFLPTYDCRTGTYFWTLVTAAISIFWYGSFNTSSGFARNAVYDSEIKFGVEVKRKILSLGLDYLIANNPSEVVEKTEGAVHGSQDFLYQGLFNNFLRAILGMMFILLTLFRLNVGLFVLCAVTLLLEMYVNLIFGSQINKEEKGSWKKVSKVNARFLDVVQNIIVTKLACNEEYEGNRTETEAIAQVPHLRRITLLWRWLTTTLNIAQNSVYVLAMFMFIITGLLLSKYTVGQVVQFTASYVMLYNFFQSMLFKYLDAQKNAPKLEYLKEVLSQNPSIIDQPNARIYPGISTGFMFEAVSFSYGSQRQKIVLKKTNLCIPKGKITVLVGESGGGKSTIANLLMRLYEPTEGRILSDGVDIRSFSLQSYRRAFSVLSQGASLFNDTIAHNIPYMRIREFDEGRMAESAKVSQIHDFITSLPDQYRTVISSGAANVSGGEKQRIALARAVYAHDAQVVVLDEPTTGLDGRTSRRFFGSVLDALAGKTLVMITHSKRVMKLADQVVFMDHGQVQMVGHHEELLETCEDYRDLVDD
jgi:ABC-type multidrug transport system fused ATPase/permease subunit